MLETAQSLTLLIIVEIVGPVLLGCGLIYGTYMYRTRARSGVTDDARDRATLAVQRAEANNRGVARGNRTQI
jgi:hypothetical protein